MAANLYADSWPRFPGKLKSSRTPDEVESLRAEHFAAAFPDHHAIAGIRRIHPVFVDKL